MLPVAALIGHKEWAPKRKPDPTYDMDERRNAVANFTGELDMTSAFNSTDRQTLDRISWRLFSMLQNASNTMGGPSAGEAEDNPLPFMVSWLALIWRMEALVAGTDTVQSGPTASEPVWVVEQINELKAMAQELLDRPPATIDPSDIDLTALASAVADEMDRRARDNDSTTGPTS